MALDNLISIQFDASEIATIESALSSIEATIAAKMVNLTPEQSQQYGKIGNETEFFITKTRTYMGSLPVIIPSFLNVTEMDNDLAARDAMKPLLQRMNSITESMSDTSRLLGADIFHAAIAVYRNTKFLSGQNVPGTTSIYNDLKAQFPGGGSGPNPPDDPAGGGTP
ncbi:MAG: hypothetical protein IPP77_06465 [Bacteroidetes bacterium]|nr:hypothetical protein [Bacteroidota bacterium]